MVNQHIVMLLCSPLAWGNWHVRPESHKKSFFLYSTHKLCSHSVLAMPPRKTAFLVLLFFSLLRSSSSGAASSTIDLLLPSDAVSLLSFKSKADTDNKLLFALNERYDYCQWQGVKCAHGRVVRFVLQSFGLRGVFPPDTLSRLDQLRVLILRNNSLSGPIPDLSSLLNLKSLFLDHNSFSGSFPPSILFLHRLLTLSLSHNNLTGSIPAGLTLLDRLISLRLDSNWFNGTIPPLNQSSLQIFNVSGNNLTGPVPMTPTLSRFSLASFSGNQGLCGEIIHMACNSRSPFFSTSNASTSAAPLGQSAESQGIVVVPSHSSTKEKHKNTALILGFTIGFSVLIASILFAITLFRKRSSSRRPESPKIQESLETKEVNAPPPSSLAVETEIEQNREWSEKAKKIENDSAMSAFDGLPLAIVVALVEGVKELVVSVGFGFEGEEGNGVGREEQVDGGGGGAGRGRWEEGEEEEDKEGCLGRRHGENRV